MILSKCKVKKPKEEKSEQEKKDERKRLIARQKEKARTYDMESVEER